MQVSPKTIELTTPLVGRQQTVDVVVKNESTTSFLAFKVKTTAPKLYCVRPNCGSIAPGTSTSVAITYQGGSNEPLVGAKCKDKFLFVGVETDVELDSKAVASQWANLEASVAGGPQQSKVRVAYKIVGDMGAIAEDIEPASADAPVAANKIARGPELTKESIEEASEGKEIKQQQQQQHQVQQQRQTQQQGQKTTEEKQPQQQIQTQGSNNYYLILVAVLVALFAAWRTF